MLAIVEIAGKQFPVSKSDKVKVPLLSGEIGDTVEFDKIFVTEDNGDTQIGTPLIAGKVKAKILEHGKDKTILVFHKKRRKGYSKLNGHRTKFTKLEITDINI